MVRSLRELESFGGTAAEDDDIEKFFVRTPAFDKVWSGRRHIVTGRKGSGKTALYLAIKNQAIKDARPVQALSFSEYPWATHARYASGDTTSIERFVETWRFFILIQSFMAVLGHSQRPEGRQINRALEEVAKFLEDNYGSTHFDFKRVFPAGGISFSEVDIRAQIHPGGSAGAKGIRAGQSLGQSLSRLNEWLEGKLVQVGSSFPITYVLFDELDLGFKPEDDNYIQRISGLLMAARRFVKWAKDKSIHVNPIVFLRSDIFDNLHFGDLNKIREANHVDLRWHGDLNHRGASLKSLIDWRIKESLSLRDEDGDPWSRVFDDQLTRGTQHKFQHIAFRTFLRPRDIIKFCNLALREAQDRDDAGAGDLFITNLDLKAARSAYSDYFLRELDDEIAESESYWRDCIEMLRSVGRSRFTRPDFQVAYKRTQNRIPLHYGEEEALRLLYRYSILGFEGTRDSGSGVTDHFRYINESINFDPAARSFLVHRALKEALDLTET